MNDWYVLTNKHGEMCVARIPDDDTFDPLAEDVELDSAMLTEYNIVYGPCSEDDAIEYYTDMISDDVFALLRRLPGATLKYDEAFGGWVCEYRDFLETGLTRSEAVDKVYKANKL
ncbi:MAG: hypothetical protein OHK0046_47780 [Anaerolineae bacterium]